MSKTFEQITGQKPKQDTVRAPVGQAIDEEDRIIREQALTPGAHGRIFRDPLADTGGTLMGTVLVPSDGTNLEIRHLAPGAYAIRDTTGRSVSFDVPAYDELVVVKVEGARGGASGAGPGQGISVPVDHLLVGPQEDAGIGDRPKVAIAPKSRFDRVPGAPGSPAEDALGDSDAPLEPTVVKTRPRAAKSRPKTARRSGAKKTAAPAKRASGPVKAQDKRPAVRKPQPAKKVSASARAKARTGTRGR